MSYKIDEYIPGKIYIVEYPIRFAGMDLFSRMTIVKLGDSKLWVHSPSKVDAKLKAGLDELGDVAWPKADIRTESKSTFLNVRY